MINVVFKCASALDVDAQIVQPARRLNDNLDVLVGDEKRAPEQAPLPFPQSESTLHHLPVERQEVVVVTLSFG